MFLVKQKKRRSRNLYLEASSIKPIYISLPLPSCFRVLFPVEAGWDAVFLETKETLSVSTLWVGAQETDKKHSETHLPQELKRHMARPTRLGNRSKPQKDDRSSPSPLPLSTLRLNNRSGLKKNFFKKKSIFHHPSVGARPPFGVAASRNYTDKPAGAWSAAALINDFL